MSTEVAALDASSDRPAPPAPKGRLVGKIVRRLVVGLAVLALALIGLGVGARYWVKTPSGRAAIVRLANGLKLGPVGRLQIEGLSGDPLDVFGLRLLRIVDANGAWLEARNVTLAWNPVEILARRVHLRRLQIGLLQVHRAPQQTKEPAQPPSKPPVSLILNDAQVRIETDPALSVQHGLWDLKVRVELHRSGRILANMSARSLLHPGDGADLALRIGKRQRFLLRADAVESQGGALSGVLGLAADQPLHVHAVGDGKSDAGGASLIATSGAATPIRGQARWSKAGLSLDGQIALSASRLTRYFAERLGPAAHVKVQAHQTRGDLYALQGQADAANGVLKIDGPVDWRSRTSAALKVDLLVRDVSKWLPQPKIGSAHTIGMVSGGIDRFVYKGDIEGADLSQSGYALSRARGPVELDLKDREWRAKVDLAGAGGAGKGMPAILIGAGPHLKADASLLKDGHVLIRSLDLTGANLKLSAQGGQGLFGGLSFKGSLVIPNVTALRAGAKGGLAATWDAGEDRNAKAWDFAFDAKGDRFQSGLADLDHFLGPQPHLVAKGDYGSGALGIASAKLDGAALSAAGKGALDAKQMLKMDFDWSAKGPIEAGPVEIAGAAKGTGKVTGALSAPRADLTAELANLNFGALSVAPAKLTLAVISGADGLNGAFSVAGPTAKYGPASAKAGFRFTPSGIDLDGIVADAGGVKLDGSLSLRSGQPSNADLTVVAGPGAFLTTGLVSGKVKIVDRPGGASADLALTGQGVSAPGAPTTLHTLSLRASGPLNQLPFKIVADSVQPVAWKFSGDGVLKRGPGGNELLLQGGGGVRKADFKLLEPADIHFGGPDQSAHLKLALAGGQAVVDARMAHDDVEAKATLGGVGLGAFNEDFVGQVSGDMTLHGHAGALTGRMNAALTGARSRDEPAAEGLTAAVKADLSANRLHIDGTAANAEGLKSQAAFDLPAEASAAPFRIAIDRTKTMSGTFSADGEVRPLWDLLAGGDRTFSGQMSVSGAVTGSMNTPLAKGRLALTGGKFRDISTGLALQSLQVDAAFGDNALTVSRFAGADPRGGTIAGDGRVSLLENGDSTFTLNLKHFQLIDNDIGRATASGAVVVAHPAKGQGKLSGTLTIDRADITAATPTPTGVVPMDVVEVHQALKEGQEKAAPKTLGPPILLDVTIKANRGVYVKGKGLAVELSLDSHVGGSVSSPDLTGVARVVTGSYDFAGKRFDVDSSGVVRLGATPGQIRLNLSATWEDPTLNAIVRVQGTAAKPEITLTSTPVLPQDEVLARVLFGVSASQLSAAQGAELASALASLSGGGGFDVIGNLRQFAGLDRLALGGTQATGTTISGGKYVTKDIYLELTGGGRNGSAAQVEWRIRHDLSLVSRYGAAQDTRYTGDTDASLSIRFRKDF